MNVDNEILSINDLVSDANNAFDKFEQIAEIAHKLLNETLADIDNVPTTKSQREILYLQANKVRNYRAICEIVQLINKHQMHMMSFQQNNRKWETYITSQHEQSKSVMGGNEVLRDQIVSKLIHD